MPHSSSIHGKNAEAAAEYLTGWQRARAELDNFRKRTRTEQAELVEYQLARSLEPLLGLNDNFRAMITHVPKELENHAWVTGVLHIARQLSDILQQFGVQEIGRVGEVFDPRRHEALEHVADSDVASGEISEVVQIGYQVKDKVLRPARVKIAA